MQLFSDEIPENSILVEAGTQVILNDVYYILTQNLAFTPTDLNPYDFLESVVPEPSEPPLTPLTGETYPYAVTEKISTLTRLLDAVYRTNQSELLKPISDKLESLVQAL